MYTRVHTGELVAENCYVCHNSRLIGVDQWHIANRFIGITSKPRENNTSRHSIASADGGIVLLQNRSVFFDP